MEMRILITGSREWSSVALIERALRHEIGSVPFDQVVTAQGGARGADACAHKAAVRLDISDYTFPANWSDEGRAAGHLRNQRMLTEFEPTLVLAFKSDLDLALLRGGTEDMIRRALTAGVPVKWCSGSSALVSILNAQQTEGVL